MSIITELAYLLEEAGKLLEEIPHEILVTEFHPDNTPYVRCVMCNAIGELYGKERHLPTCIGVKSAALLPKIRWVLWVLWGVK